jgi:hypothetical protein
MDPERILANINILHRKMLEAMKTKQLHDVEGDLAAEVSQYKVVVTQFKRLKIPELVMDAVQRQTLLQKSLHSLRETMHATRYQELRDLVTAAKKSGEFKVVKQHLLEMQNITRVQRKVEKDGKEKGHVKKLDGILAGLNENMDINDFFIEYKDLEASYNRASGAVTNGSYRVAHEISTQRILKIERLHERLMKIIAKKPDLQKLFDNVVKLQALYDQLEGTVRNGYKQMLNGSTLVPVRPEAFTANLELPPLSDIGKNQDLSNIIAYLDEQFTRWDGNKEKQVEANMKKE